MKQLKLVSVTKTSTFIVEEEGVVTRERILQLSHNWTERDIILFKKIAKQGGTCRLKGAKITAIPGEKITTSKGWADEGAPKMHGPEE
jgi:hypothetical protein|tara:strand:+ start:713 stop:976 length:264 start_codon:yes stop_codon:yes gene_type:complete